MNNKRGIIGLVLVLVILLTLSISVYALSESPAFSAEAVDIKEKVPLGDYFEFDVVLKNRYRDPDNIKIHAFTDLNWALQVVPSIDYYEGVSLGKYETKSTKLLIKPSADVGPGKYRLKVPFESKRTGEIIDVYMIVTLEEKAEELKLKPDVDVSLEIPPVIDPRNKYFIKVNLKNNNELKLEDIVVKLSSKFINEETTVSLESNEEKSISFTVNLPEDTGPQTDILKILITRDDKTFLSTTNDYEIVEYVEPFEKEVDIKKKILKTISSVHLVNTGNVEKKSQVRIETTWKEKLFTKTTPKADVQVINNKYFFVWNVELQPGESKELKMVTSYRWATLILILIIIAVLVYFFKRNPLVVKKYIKSLHYHEGGIKEFKVVLDIKNTSRRKLTDVKIIERIPKVFGIKKGSFERTLRPASMKKHPTQGIIISYRIDELEGYEERILHYVLKARVHILGSVRLKPAIVKFKDRKGNMFKSVSDGVEVK